VSTEATSYRMTLTLQPLTEAGETVGDAVKVETETAIAARATFDPSRRVIAMAARDLGEQAAAAFHAALEPVVTR
jgi:hypothetical protein